MNITLFLNLVSDLMAPAGIAIPEDLGQVLHLDIAQNLVELQNWSNKARSSQANIVESLGITASWILVSAAVRCRRV